MTIWTRRLSLIQLLNSSSNHINNTHLGGYIKIETPTKSVYDNGSEGKTNNSNENANRNRLQLGAKVKQMNK